MRTLTLGRVVDTIELAITNHQNCILEDAVTWTYGFHSSIWIEKGDGLLQPPTEGRVHGGEEESATVPEVFHSCASIFGELNWDVKESLPWYAFARVR